MIEVLEFIFRDGITFAGIVVLFILLIGLVSEMKLITITKYYRKDDES
jgi:hypothetical protein